MSQFSISGAVSGLDTAAIINQLVAVDARQQQLMTNRMNAAQRAADAYGGLITSLRGLADQARSVARTSGWQGTTASSSSTTVAASASGTSPASLTFDVTALAAAHSVISADAVSAPAAVVASGPLTLTDSAGAVHTIDVGGGTLAEVVIGINDADAGVRATALQVAPGQYRLQVVARQSGSASQFTLDGLDGFTGLDVTAEGADAKILLGTNPLTAFEVTSTSNTFADVVPGLSFTVSRLETGVTVASSLDGGAVADDIAALVETANAVLADVTKQTAYNTETRTGGPLTGQSAARRLQQAILDTVGGSGAAGIELTRDGRLAFDRAEFLAAFAADPAAVAQSYGARTAFDAAPGVTGSASLVRAGDNTRGGSYAVKVLVSSAREQWRADPGGAIAGRTVLVMRGSMIVSYTAGVGDTLADAVNAINIRAAQAGIGVGATIDGGSILLTSVGAGAAGAFTVQLDSAPAVQVVVGRDVEGEIDGVPATGRGDVLSLADDADSGAAGLALRVQVDDADVAASGGEIGSVNYGPGLAQKLLGLVADATSTEGGLLRSAQDGQQATVTDLQDQVDAWDRRLESRRLSLQRQFAALETTLSALRSQASIFTGGTTTTG